MANAIMSAIPPEKAGVGAGVNGTLAEFGRVSASPSSARCSTPGSRRCSRVAAASLPAALAAAGSAGGAGADHDAFASGLETSQLVGAVAVLLGGLLAAVLLRRAGAGSRPGGRTA